MMLNKGSYNGRRSLSPASVEVMTIVLTLPQSVLRLCQRIGPLNTTCCAFESAEKLAAQKSDDLLLLAPVA